MMKKSISWMVFLLLMTGACAQAAPQLTNVTADGESLHAGEGWTVSFETTEGGALAMQLRGTEGEIVDLGATQVDAGSGELVWDGVLPDGSEAADGVYTVAVQLRNYWGEESEESLLPLTIGETNAAVSGVPDTLDLNSLDIQEAQIWEGGIEEAQVWDEGETANGEPTADENGRRVKCYRTYPTLAQARRGLREFSAERDGLRRVSPRSITLDQWLEYWMEQVIRPNRAQTTVYGYGKIIRNHLSPALGDVPLQKLTPQHLQGYYAMLMEQKGLSANTVRRHHDLLSCALHLAVRQDMLLRSPTDRSRHG